MGSPGKWPLSTSRSVTPNAIPTNKYATYTVEKPADVYAIYSATDNSLSFYKNNDHPLGGGTYNGKDSTYVLYKLVKEYDLKIKTFTLDNGFLSDEAKEKINAIVKDFNVDHEYITLDEKLIKDIYHFIVGKYLSPCIALDLDKNSFCVSFTPLLAHLGQPHPNRCTDGFCQNSPCSGHIIQTLVLEFLYSTFE